MRISFIYNNTAKIFEKVFKQYFLNYHCLPVLLNGLLFKTFIDVVLIVNFERDVTHCSGVTIVDFGQVNTGWECLVVNVD